MFYGGRNGQKYRGCGKDFRSVTSLYEVTGKIRTFLAVRSQVAVG
jgi:hypothetical protein